MPDRVIRQEGETFLVGLAAQLEHLPPNGVFAQVALRHADDFLVGLAEPSPGFPVVRIFGNRARFFQNGFPQRRRDQEDLDVILPGRLQVFEMPADFLSA